MAGFRALRERSRLALHRALEVPALYIQGANPPLLIHVRVHTEWGATGDVKGTSFAYAERQDISPEIVFLVSEIVPKNGAIISVAEGEAYRVDNVSMPENITVKAEVAKLTVSQTAGLPLPPPPGT